MWKLMFGNILLVTSNGNPTFKLSDQEDNPHAEDMPEMDLRQERVTVSRVVFIRKHHTFLFEMSDVPYYRTHIRPTDPAFATPRCKESF